MIVHMLYDLGEEEKSIGEMGHTLGFYVPKQAKQYVERGDKFRVSTRLVNGEVEIVARRRVFNFELDEVRKYIEKVLSQLVRSTEFDGTRILEATSDKISLKSMQSDYEKPLGLVRIIVNGHLFQLSPQDYRKSREWVSELGNKFNTSFKPEGDIDTIKLIEHPEFYDLKGESDLFERLTKLGKKIDASITIRLDNKNNKLEDLGTSIDFLNDLTSRLQTQ